MTCRHNPIRIGAIALVVNAGDVFEWCISDGALLPDKLENENDKQNIKMVSLVAAIPAYVQGNNPKCIEAVTRRIAGMLDVEVDLSDLSAISEEFEKKLHEVVLEQPELESNIHKLEEDYDNEIFNNEMGDLKTWLEQQGIRVD